MEYNEIFNNTLYYYRNLKLNEPLLADKINQFENIKIDLYNCRKLKRELEKRIYSVNYNNIEMKVFSIESFLIKNKYVGGRENYEQIARNRLIHSLEFTNTEYNIVYAYLIKYLLDKIILKESAMNIFMIV